MRREKVLEYRVGEKFTGIIQGSAGLYKVSIFSNRTGMETKLLPFKTLSQATRRVWKAVY